MSDHESRRWLDVFRDSVLKSWYSAGGWTRVLLPLSWLYQILAKKQKMKKLAAHRWQPTVPVLVVGNITVGGTGKTPFVASLVKRLQREGYHPGIASRGFGSSSLKYPVAVTADSNPVMVGDEPVMLAKQLDVPLVVDPDRVSAARALVQDHGCDLIVTDDGLQHYSLRRHIEIVIIDGQRMLGNRCSIPAGPMREKPLRLSVVDQIMVNGHPSEALEYAYDCFYLEPDELKPVSVQLTENVAPVTGRVHAVAGIGNPQRFFNTLASLGYQVIPHAFPDHHAYQSSDLAFDDDLPIIMTAKDAVKCTGFADSRYWYLPVQAKAPESVFHRILQLIETKGPQRRSDKDDHGQEAV